MDHQTANRLAAPEQYILGQLPQSTKEEFEEHMADCSTCFEDVTILDGFAANAGAVFAERSRADRRAPKESRWSFLPAWLGSTPAFAMSGGLNLALLAVVGYSFLNMIPGYERRLQNAEQPAVTEAFRLPGSTRGVADVFHVKSSSGFAVLRFDNPENQKSFTYVLEGNGARRSGALSGSLSGGLPSDESLNMIVPLAGLEAGDYRFTLAATQGSNQVEMGRCTIRIQPE